jgi:hypothetical protein
MVFLLLAKKKKAAAAWKYGNINMTAAKNKTSAKAIITRFCIKHKAVIGRTWHKAIIGRILYKAIITRILYYGL